MRDDQATGLRRLFVPPPPSALCVAGVGATSIAVDLAVALARLGRRVLLIDRSRGDVAVACGLKARYDLVHALDGDKAWRDVVVPGPDGITLLPAARGLAEMECDKRDWRAEILKAIGDVTRYDVWLVNGLPPTHGDDVTVLLPVAPTASAITGAYARIKVLALQRARLDLRVVVHGAPSIAAARDAFDSVAETARRFLRTHLDYCGAIPAGRAPADARTARGKAFLNLAEELCAAPRARAIAS